MSSILNNSKNLDSAEDWIIQSRPINCFLDGYKCPLQHWCELVLFRGFRLVLISQTEWRGKMKGSRYQAIINPTQMQSSQAFVKTAFENLAVSLKRWPQRPDNGLQMRDRIDVGTLGQENISQRARCNQAGDDLDHTSPQLTFKESRCNHGAAAGRWGTSQPHPLSFNALAIKVHQGEMVMMLH